MGQRIPASERTHQRLEQLLEEGIGDGDARAELIKLAVPEDRRGGAGGRGE
jgi:hypothetical protein